MKLNERTVTKPQLDQCVNDWAKQVYGPDFKFRPKQLDTIIDILMSWFYKTSDVILDAPTGSGKSIIAMTVAGVLSDCFDKKGYILISDLSLLKQYEDDVNMYLPSWGVIRGQQTYNCLVNGLNFKVGVCHLHGVNSYSAIEENYPECAPYCEYLVSRKKAMNSKVTICTYTNWLLQQNYVRPKFVSKDMPAPFEKRDFVICDEAHKLVNIIQNHFSPRLGKNDIAKIFNVIDASNCATKPELKKEIDDVRDKIAAENDKTVLLDLIKQYRDLMYDVAKYAEKVKNDIGGTDPSHHLTKDERSISSNNLFANE